MEVEEVQFRYCCCSVLQSYSLEGLEVHFDLTVVNCLDSMCGLEVLELEDVVGDLQNLVHLINFLQVRLAHLYAQDE